MVFLFLKPGASVASMLCSGSIIYLSSEFVLIHCLIYSHWLVSVPCQLSIVSSPVTTQMLSSWKSQIASDSEPSKPGVSIPLTVWHFCSSFGHMFILVLTMAMTAPLSPASPHILPFLQRSRGRDLKINNTCSVILTRSFLKVSSR